MRHTILLDNKITQQEYEAWKHEDSAFWQKYTGITPTYGLMRQDFANYPTSLDKDGDIVPTKTWLQSLNDLVTSIYGQFGVDFIIVAIHEDNWKSVAHNGRKGIWGTNYSYVYGKQHLQYCRWDKDNPASTFGTLYHERHHALDALVRQEVGLNIEPLLGVSVGQYDKCVTHGGCDPWQYIRYKENVASLKKIAPLLKRACEKRQQLHRDLECDRVNVFKRGFALVRYLLRMRGTRKDGVVLS